MRSGIKTLVVGMMLFIVGAFIVPIALILPFILNDSDEWQFLVPGTTEVTIEEPGRYYLWNDFRTVLDGKTYNRSDSIPDGLEIVVLNEDGEKLPFNSDTSISSSSGSSSRNSIGYVEVSKSSKLTVSVSGSADEGVFSISESGIMKVLGLFLGGFGLSILLALSGVGITIWGIIKLVKSKHRPDRVAGSD